MGYIRNLDGLRALAIAAVLVFHLSEAVLPGGFVGVDMFFVISGFIITRGLCASEGDFSLRTFYARRIARLLPAAMVTLAVTLFASVWLLGPVDRVHVADTAIAAVFLVSNMFFSSHAGYFDDVLAGNPLLHFWSLSVEEQFYLFWPLLILGLARLGRARAARWVLGLTVFSTAVAAGFAALEPVIFFYATLMRAFQFLLGACLVYWPARTTNAPLSNAVFAAGLAGAFASFGLASGADYVFATAALLPALATVAMIYAIDSVLADLCLGSAPVRALGRAAYSIYLVHWPLIVFYRLRFGAIDSVGEGGLLAVASVALGGALRLGVENPLRLRHEDSVKRRKLRIAFALVVSTLCAAIYVSWTSAREEMPSLRVAGAPRLPTAAELNAATLARRRSAAFTDQCQLFEWASLGSLDVDGCLEGDVLLIGDSWMPDTLIALEAAFDDAPDAPRIAKLGGAACGQVLPEAVRMGQVGCRDLVGRRQQAMTDRRYRAIVLAVNWRGVRERDLRPAFDALRATGQKIVILSDRPYFEAKVPTLLGALPAESVLAEADLTPHLEPRAEAHAAAMRRVVADYPEFVFVDQREVLCPGACPAFTPDGALLYLDRSHLTVEGAQYLGRTLRDELRSAVE